MDEDGQGSFVASFQKYYDFSNKIMVAAIVSLSLVIVLMCILHLYARHLIRRRDRSRAAARALAFRIALARSERQGLRRLGLGPSAIAAIPLFEYRDKGNGDEQYVECSVCLSAFEDGDAVRVLPNCNHSFHAECIDKWLGSNTTGPVCRAGAMQRLRMESREPPVRSGQFEMVVTIRTVGPDRSASILCLEGASDEPSSRAAASGKDASSSARFCPIRRILSWERTSARSESNGREDGTERDTESR